MAVVTALLAPILFGVALVDCAAKGALPAAVDVGGATATFQVHKVEDVPWTWGSNDPVFVLVMGTDARPGQTGPARGDALHLVGVNPGTGQATILNIPRDTWVPVPGHGIDKINVGNYYGGPALEAQAVGDLVGVHIPYVISTGFEGFMNMVDEMGGFDIDVPYPMDDPNSDAHFQAGPTHMLGGEALAFSRDRHLEGGDLTRSHDQSLVILAALAKLRGEGVSPGKVMQWLEILVRNGSYDGVGAGDLYRLGRLALSLDPANVRTVTMPGTLGWAAQQSVVFVAPEADALFADFRDDAVLQEH